MPSDDPTLLAADNAMERCDNAKIQHGAGIGMSEIGSPCMRKIWYSFRWCVDPAYPAKKLKQFEDGLSGEKMQARRLSLVDGVKLYTADQNTGTQFRLSDLDGHLVGYMDGCISGLLHDPGTWHVWEHKQEQSLPGDDKCDLKKLNDQHYGQAALYMHYSGMTRHYMTISSPGCRRVTSIITEADEPYARFLVERAKKIIAADSPPMKSSEAPDYYVCKMCHASDICHGGSMPAVNCRTCAHSTPLPGDNARWACEWHQTDIDYDTQRMGAQCPQHLFIPDLLSWSAIDKNEKLGTITYETPDGCHVTNGQGHYSSNEIKADPDACGIPVIDELKNTFNARLISKNEE